MAAKTVETFRTTTWLQTLVRRAAKLEQKRPSEFLRQAAEEKAKQVIREHERARLKRLLAEIPPGNLTDEEAARLGDEMRREVGKRALRGRHRGRSEEVAVVAAEREPSGRTPYNPDDAS